MKMAFWWNSGKGRALRVVAGGFVYHVLNRVNALMHKKRFLTTFYP
jgi:hypothetical protein